MKFRRFVELFEEGKSFEYKVPSDKETRLYDFYVLEMLTGLAEHKLDIHDPDGIGGNTKHSFDLYALKEAENKLLPVLKKDILSAMLVSMSSEMRHADHSNGSDFLPEHIRPVFGEFIRNLIIFGLDKNFHEKSSRHRSTEATPTLYSYKERMRSIKAANKTAKIYGHTKLVEMFEEVFRKGRWDHSYGGKAWGDIAATWLHLFHANTKDKIRTYIDHAYDLQHNTGSVFNKIKEYLKNGDHSWLASALDLKYEATPWELVDHSSLKSFGRRLLQSMKVERNFIHEPLKKGDMVEYTHPTNLKNQEAGMTFGKAYEIFDTNPLYGKVEIVNDHALHKWIAASKFKLIQKLNLNSEGFFDDKLKMGNWLRENLPAECDFAINDDLSVDIDGNGIPIRMTKMFKNLNLKHLPFKINVCYGTLDISNTSFSSLKGCPDKILPSSDGNSRGDFIAKNCKLTTLKEGPKYVAGSYLVDGNQLSNLEGVATQIAVDGGIFSGMQQDTGKDFSHSAYYDFIEKKSGHIDSNDEDSDAINDGFLQNVDEIESWLKQKKDYLIYSGLVIKADLTIDANEFIIHSDYQYKYGKMNQLPFKFNVISNDFKIDDLGLKTLKGCPRIVGGDFHADGNEIENLKGGPKEVFGHYYVQDCELTSLDGAPLRLKGTFYGEHQKNTKASLFQPSFSHEDYLEYIVEKNKSSSEEDANKNSSKDPTHQLTELLNWILPFNKTAKIEGDRVVIEGYLDFSYNSLTSLPESFGNLKVGGYLYLSYNKLTSLPESFGNLKVGGNLSLSNNKLTSLPESFGNLKVGGGLSLYNNKLTSLPDSFGNLKVGGHLYLYNNSLISLPESFGNLKVGGDLNLNNNKLTSLPKSFGNLEVGGEINLVNNPIKDPSKENNKNLPVFIKQPLSKNILQNKFSSGYIKSMQDIDSPYSSANDDDDDDDDDEPPEPLKI